MKILSGTSNLKLSKDIAKKLKLKLVNTNIRRFADGEIYIEINENIRGNSVFVIQSTSNPANDNLMELLLVVEAPAKDRRVGANEEHERSQDEEHDLGAEVGVGLCGAHDAEHGDERHGQETRDGGRQRSRGPQGAAQSEDRQRAPARRVQPLGRSEGSQTHEETQQDQQQDLPLETAHQDEP